MTRARRRARTALLSLRVALEALGMDDVARSQQARLNDPR
jgi:hypothetical protein